MSFSTSLRPEPLLNYDGTQVSDAVAAAIDAGRKIEAIKILRDETGLGLAAAKDVVDRLARERQGPPIGPAAPGEENGAGSLFRTALLVAIILIAYFYFFAS